MVSPAKKTTSGVGHSVEGRARTSAFEIFEQAPVPIVACEGPQHRIVLFNAQARALLPPERQHPHIGEPFGEAFPAIKNSKLLAIMSETFADGRARQLPEYAIPIPNAQGTTEERIYSSLVHPVVDSNGRIEGVILAGYEVTEQMRAREQLAAARAHAEAATRAKDEFLAMLGHELRNPLAPMVTALELLRVRGAQSRELEVLGRQVGHLTRLVDDLLDVTRITRGKTTLQRRFVEMWEIVAHAIEIASPLLEQRRDRLEVQVERSGLGVNADPDRMTQVISNLLTNAAKYSEPGSRILVRGEAVGDKVRVSVKDWGVGIAADMLSRVFDVFVQQRQTLERASGGLGLGLTIVKGLVDQHGGTVSVHSEGLGKGSEFVVELPRLDPSEELGCPASKPAERHDKGNVLVVDDNEDAANMLATALRDLGYRVEVAHDGPTALRKAKTFEPTIALLDIGLPVMDGYELARRLRQESAAPGSLRLIAVTGYGQDSDRQRSADAGFLEHLIKPVDLAALTRVLSNE
ncbi:MAG TPA: ATP-binding protein [Polyangiaceae bacterium]